MENQTLQHEQEDLVPATVSQEELLQIYQTLFNYWISRGLFDLAEDLAQEGVLKCQQNAGKWKASNKASLKTFLVTVGKNRGIDYLRKELRQEKIKDRCRTLSSDSSSASE